MAFDASWEDGQTAHADWLNAVETKLNEHDTMLAAINFRASAIYQFRFSSTMAQPPQSGQVRYNVSPPTTTALWVSDITDDGIDITMAWTTLDIGDEIYIQTKSNAANFNRFQVTGAVTGLVAPPDSPYVEIPVSVVDSGGSAFGGGNPISLVIVNQ